MNILTFDIEEWSIYKHGGGRSPKKFAEFDCMLDQILEILSENKIRATFFCLGKIASDFPHVIYRIASCGHEIGCHSDTHRWVNKMTPDEFMEDTHNAVGALEDVLGKKVVSYRAPAFSIGSQNKWAFDILAENGIENDASIFPGIRDFGGFPDFPSQIPCIIDTGNSKIKEFPIPLFKLPILGRKIAYSGGGYFRLMPLFFVRGLMRKEDYSMCYFHIADLLTERAPMMSRANFEDYFKESGPLPKRLIRYFKSNVGRSGAIAKMEALLKIGNFLAIADAGSSAGITRIINV